MTSEGQITLPKGIRKYLGIHAVDQINFEMTSDRAVVLQPCKKALSIINNFNLIYIRFF